VSAHGTTSKKNTNTFLLSTDPPFDTLRWYREAELQHGRVAQLAWLGFVFPAVVGHFPSVPGYDFGELNPIDAFYKAPSLALAQIFLFAGALEGRRYKRCFEGDYAPGDHGWGVPGGWNPIGLGYSEEEYAEKELQEIKHCRLAMLGAIGALSQNLVTGEGVTASFSKAFFEIPEFTSKAAATPAQALLRTNEARKRARDNWPGDR